MRKGFLLFAIIWPAMTYLGAQPINKSSYETMLLTANQQLEQQEYYNALEWYEKAYAEKEDRTLVPTIARLHFLLRDYVKAERWYRRIMRRDKEDEFLAERFTYGRLLKMNGNYEEAIQEFQTFIAKSDNDSLKELAQIELTGAELAREMPDLKQGVVIQNLGKDINTPLSEYSPALARTGDKLYFSSFGPDQKEVIVVTDKNKDDYHAKIFAASKSDKGWSGPQMLDPKINRPGFHSTNLSFSPDGRRMYFTRSTLQGLVLKESKIYVSEYGDGEWLGANEVQGVNGDYIAKQPAAGELFGNEVLFFISDMPGGYGGFDIYYATYKGNGVFADPVNLGPKINTIGDEETPFYREGTLYFSSTGHPGLGGFDIFYTVWDGSTWSEPRNMGKSYNTSYDDYYFTIDADGYSGFLTSNRPEARSAHGRTCCDDIYQYSIARMFADLVVGVFDEQRKPLLGGTVELITYQNNKPGDVNSQTQEKGNRFDYGLELEMPYMVIASREGYYPDSMQFNTVGLKESKTFEHRFFLKAKPVPPPAPDTITVTIEEPIVLENILYDFDDDRIKLEAESDLQYILELMNQYPEMKIELGSHTDYRGDDTYNKNLSQRRAESARRWLVRNGVNRERIAAQGYGESVPQTVTAKMAATHDFLKAGDVLTQEFIDKLPTEEQREVAHSINRRTEFKITEGPTSIKITRTRIEKKEEVKEAPKGRNSLPQAAPPQIDPARISPLSSLYGKKNLKGVPIMYFNQREIDFGKVKRGEKREHTFEFTNIGDTDLMIAVVTACECTETDYSVRPVKPGAKGKIKVVFDSTEKEESETIDVDIMLDNTDPATGNPIMETVRYRYELVK